MHYLASVLCLILLCLVRVCRQIPGEEITASTTVQAEASKGINYKYFLLEYNMYILPNYG